MICKLWRLLLLMFVLFTDVSAKQDPELYEKSMEDRLKELHISTDFSNKIASGGPSTFENMDPKQFNKLTPDIIADVGKEAIENLQMDQVKSMGKHLYMANEEHLNKIFTAINKDQLSTIMDSIQEMNTNSSEREHLNCIQFEPIIEALKRLSGKPSQWDKSVFDKLGSDFVKCLPPRYLKQIAGNKDVFKSVLKNVKNTNKKHKRLSVVERKSLLEGATTAFGAMKDWQLEDLKSASSLVTMLKPKNLKELDTAVVKDAIEDLGMQEWDEKRGKEVLLKLKDPSKGFGNVVSWTPDVVKKLGNLRGSLSRKELSQISNDTLRQSVKAFGNTSLPPYKKRTLGKRLKTLYGNPSSWTTDHIRNASNILGGMEIDDLEGMDDDALVEALPSVNHIELPRHKGRVLAKKIQAKLGNVHNWTVSAVKKIGPLVKDLPVTMLNNLRPDEAREAVKMLRERPDVPLSKKRVLIKQAIMSGGNTSKLSVKEFGEFVTEFPLTELKKIESVNDLLPDDSPSNDSSGVDIEAMWNPSQARTLVEDLVTSTSNWGPVTQTNDNWKIMNIKKLGRLGLGLRKSELDNLSIASFPDFAAEFSQVSNWTNGQTKKIASRFMKSYKNRESEITVTDIASLGDLVVDVSHVHIKKLSKETAREAVRLMGASHLLRRLPKGLKQKKAKTALELLGKDIPSLTGDELDDLGYLVSGFQPEDIADISTAAFIDAVVTLGEVEDLEKENTEALAAKAIDAYGGASSLDGEILHELGNIVEGLTSDDITDIPEIVIEENIHVFAEATLEADVAQAVVTKTESSRRKRRALVMSSKTGDELIEMGSTLLALTKDQIVDITDDAFSSAVAEISQIKGFTSVQLQAWASKTKAAWGSNTGVYTEDQLLQLNEFAQGFTGDELKSMSITSNEVIESLGTVTGYSQDQVTKLLEKIKSSNAIQDFTGDDLKALGAIASGLTTTEIGQIGTEAYQNAALELGDVQGWSTEQTTALKNKAVATFGAVSSWSAAQMSLVGAAIGGFTVDEIKSITSDQLDAIKPSALQQITPEMFKEFSVAQLSELSPEQASFVTDNQRNALSSQQKEILLQVQTDTLGYTSGVCPTKWRTSLVFSILFVLFFQKT